MASFTSFSVARKVLLTISLLYGFLTSSTSLLSRHSLPIRYLYLFCITKLQYDLINHNLLRPELFLSRDTEPMFTVYISTIPVRPLPSSRLLLAVPKYLPRSEERRVGEEGR